MNPETESIAKEEKEPVTDARAQELQEIYKEYRAAKLIVATQLLWGISAFLEAVDESESTSATELLVTAEAVKTLSDI